MNTADTYKGESLQKKMARFATHQHAATFQEQFYPGSFCRGLHVVLASREGGDFGPLASLGVPRSSMVGLDRCQSAIQECAAKWSASGVGDDDDITLVHCEDAATELGHINECLGRVKGLTRAPCPVVDCWVERWALRSQYPYVASVFWDFCSHLDKATIDAIAYTWRCLSIGSVLSVGVLKGREKAQAELRVQLAPANRKERRSWRTRMQPSYVSLSEMMRGSRPWNVPLVLDMMRSESGSHARSAASIRHKLMIYALSLADRSAMPTTVGVIEYQSSTKESNGVPMLICSFAKMSLQDGRATPTPKAMKIDDGMALEWRNGELLASDTETAAAVLNVPKATASAWKAHVTRGTYQAAE